MTHETEATFREAVVERLEDLWGADRVETDVRLPSDRICDIYVKTPGAATDIAIEAENDWEAVLTGCSQAALYGAELAAEPFVVVPASHVEMPEVFYLSAVLPVSILPLPDAAA